MQKLESKWRTEILQHFRKTVPWGFIWAHDAHFRHGFPDLTMIYHPGKVIHAELKVRRQEQAHLLQGLEPRQEITLKQISDSGGRALVFVLNPNSRNVAIVDMKTNSPRWRTREEFEQDLTAGTF